MINSEECDDLFEEMALLEKEYIKLTKHPAIKEYLEAELAMCRMIQRCGTEIMTSVDMEIGGMMDGITN